MHPFVERLKPEPDQPARQVTCLTGLLGKSDRDGYYRFYLNDKLDYYAECRNEDLVYTETISPEQSPFDGMEATRASILRDATIYYIWARTPRPVDELDLAARPAGGRGLDSAPLFPFPTPPKLTPYSLVIPSALGAFGNGLGPGDTLLPDQWIISPNGQFLFWYQRVGYLVLYDMSTWPWRQCWASDRSTSGSDECVMQTDGNLVVYAGATPIWSSETSRNNGSSLSVENDGRVIIYSPIGTLVWARP